MSRLPGVAVVALGLGLVVGHAVHLMDHPTAGFNPVASIALSATVAGVGVWAVGGGIRPGNLSRFGLWTVGVTLGLSGLGRVLVVEQMMHGTPIPHPEFVMLDFAAIGALAGVLVGVYDCQLQETVEDLSTERDRSEVLQVRLRVLNRVLRHDIRTDVNVIEGYLDLLLSSDDPDDRADHEQRIRSRIRSLTRTADRARYLESLVAEESNREEEVALDDAIRAATGAVGDRYPELSVSVSQQSGVFVRSTQLLAPALEAVLENAVEHNDAADPRVEVSVTTTAETAVVSVTDDGPGIPAAEVEALQAETESPLEHTSGLGLWLAKWATNEAQGRLEFEETDDGTTVKLVFQRA